MYTGTLQQVSNRSTFELLVQLLDDETGEPMLLSGLTIVCALRPAGGDNPTLVASTAGGTTGAINIIDVGVCQVLFPASAMRVCAPQDYDIGLTAKVDDDDISQPFVGGISIIDGVVNTP